MKKFDVLRYLKKSWFIILLFVIIGLAAGTYVLKSMQEYTASVVLAYTSTLAEDGLNADGTKLDPLEITSPTIIESAISKMDIEYTSEDIRSGLSVHPVIPTDVASLQEGSWAHGIMYDYTPTEYRVTLTMKTKQVSKILEMIIDSYLEYYADNHISMPTIPNSSDNLSRKGFSYLEFADILSDYIDERTTYLESFDTDWGAFRSSDTGYSFSEFIKQYNLLRSNRLLNVYALIFENNACENDSQLIDKYRFEISENEKRIVQLTADSENVQQIISVYSDKNKENSKTFYNLNKNRVSSDFDANTILADNLYYEDDAGKFHETTYDELLDIYYSKNAEIATLEAKNLFKQNVIMLLEGNVDAAAQKTDSSEGNVERVIASSESIGVLLDSIVEEIQELDENVLKTVKEYSAVSAFKDIQPQNTVAMGNKLNIKLILLLLAIWLVILGCCAAIVVGALRDMAKAEPTEEQEEAVPDEDPDAAIESIEKKHEEFESFAEGFGNIYLPVPYTLIAAKLNGASELKERMGVQKYSKFIDNCLSCMESAASRNGQVFLSRDDVIFCFLENGTAPLCDSIIEKFTNLVQVLGNLADFTVDYSINTWSRLFTFDELVKDVSEKLSEEVAVLQSIS